jgi:hypothetical protein
LRPLPLTILLSIPLIATMLYLGSRTNRSAARELLRRAQRAEATLRSAGQGVHREIQLEERRPSDQKLIARRRIEVWQRAGKSHEITRAERIYDENNVLIAGAWGKTDGARAIKRRAPKDAFEGMPIVAMRREPGRSPHNIDEAALLSLSAQSFSDLTAAGDITVEERPEAYLLSYSPPAVQAATPLLVQARLTVPTTAGHRADAARQRRRRRARMALHRSDL